MCVCVCACTGVLQLLAPGDLPAHDWSARGGRGPGQSGSIHPADARPVRLLSMFMSRAVRDSYCSQEHPVMTSKTKTLHLQALMSISNQTELSDKAAPADVDASKQQRHYITMTVLLSASSPGNRSRWQEQGGNPGLPPVSRWPADSYSLS